MAVNSNISGNCIERYRSTFSFRFLKKNNAFLTADVVCSIEKGEVVSLHKFFNLN